MPQHFEYFQEESTDDVDTFVLITRKEFFVLNQKLYCLLAHSMAFSKTNFENIVSTHKAIMEMLTSANPKSFEDKKNLIKETNKNNYFFY